MPVRGIIAAVSEDRVIGLNGDIPWTHRGDQKRFKEVTLGSTIIMGRLTWESLPKKPLPERRNIVITRSYIDGVDCFRTIQSALSTCREEDVWFIGGARIYREAMQHADVIDLTHVPDVIDDPDAVHFPEIREDDWVLEVRRDHEHNPLLMRSIWRRREEELK